MTLDRAERRSYREYRPYESERQADFTSEKFTDEKYVLQTLVRRVGGTRRVLLELLTFATLAVTLGDTGRIFHLFLG